MPLDDDDDLFDGEFDFVDDDEFGAGILDPPASDDDTQATPVKKRKTASSASSDTPRKKVAKAAPKKVVKKKVARRKVAAEPEVDDEPVEAAEAEVPTPPPAPEPEPPRRERTFRERPQREHRSERTPAHAAAPADDQDSPDTSAEGPDEAGDEYGRPAPKPNYLVHVYEHRKFRRTLKYEFTPEDADAFCTTFNKTGRPYGRFAIAARNDLPARSELAPN